MAKNNRDKFNIPKQVITKAVMTDTGIQWHGLKVFVLIPLTGGNNPGEIAKLFNKETMLMVKRGSQITLRDIYQYEQIVRQKIEAGESLTNNGHTNTTSN